MRHYIKHNHDSDYGKGKDHYTRLKNRIPNAVSNAQWLVGTHWQYDERPIWQLNPYTDVHRILQKIDTLI